MVITSATFVENIVLFIRDLLKTSVTDPLARTSGVGFVMTSYPKRQVQYPIITVKQVNINTNKLGMSSEVHQAIVRLEVRIWARNSKESDELTSDVIEALRTNEYGTNSTDDADIYGFNIKSANELVEDEGDNSIHSKILEVEYKAILTS